MTVETLEVWNRILGLAAAFSYRAGWNLLWVFMVGGALVCASISNLQEEERGKVAVAPVAVKISELSKSYADLDVSISGAIDQATYLQSGEYNKYYLLVDGGQGILVRYNSGMTVPQGVTTVEGYVEKTFADLKQGIDRSAGSLGDVKIRNDVYIDVGFDHRHGGMPVWANWTVLVLAGFGLATFLSSLLKGHIIFSPECDEDLTEPAQELEFFGYVGPLHIGHDRQKLFIVPARIKDTDGVRAIVSSIRVPIYTLGRVTSFKAGDWNLRFPPDSLFRPNS